MYGIRRKKTFLRVLSKHLQKFFKKQSLQEMFNRDIRDWRFSRFLVIETASCISSAVYGCYFFSINPALLIAIDHMTFVDFERRVGSEKDVHAIRKTCRQLRMPLLVFEDGSAEEVQELLHLIQTTDLSFLKHLFVIVMSHGEEGDIIYTKTATYNAQDVKDAVLKNESLKNVETVLLCNFCRGGFDATWDTDEQPFEPTDTSDLDDTTAVVYSAWKGCVSKRDDDGSPCVQKFTRELKNSMQEISLSKLHEKIEKELLIDHHNYFERMSELCSKQGVEHVINMEFRNLHDFLDQYRSFEKAIEARATPAVDSRSET